MPVTWHDLETHPITAAEYLDEWYPRSISSGNLVVRDALGDAQRRALTAIEWKYLPPYFGWQTLMEQIAWAINCAAEQALRRAPTQRTERIALASGCVVHRVAAWAVPEVEGTTRMVHPWEMVQSLEEYLKPRRRKPHHTHVHALAEWRRRQAEKLRQRAAYQAMVWTAPPTNGAWSVITHGIAGAEDWGEYAHAHHVARAKGKAPPTWEQLSQRNSERQRTEYKRRWQRFVAKRDAQQGAGR